VTDIFFWVETVRKLLEKKICYVTVPRSWYEYMLIVDNCHVCNCWFL